MKQPDPKHDILELSELEHLFDAPRDVSVLKEIDHVDANYAAWIAASPFLVLGMADRAASTVHLGATRPVSCGCSIRRRF